MLGPPSSVAGVFIPSDFEPPTRKSSSEVGVTVHVMPLAVCQFMTRLTIPAPWPDGPGRAVVRRRELVVEPCAETRERRHFAADVVVGSNVALVVGIGGRKQRGEVLGIAGKVRRRQRVEHGRAEFRDQRCGNGVIRKHRPVIRIHHRHRKHSASLIERRNTGGGERFLQPAQPFVIAKQEKLVLLYGTARRSAELILDVDRLLRRRWV